MISAVFVSEVTDGADTDITAARTLPTHAINWFCSTLRTFLFPKYNSWRKKNPFDRGIHYKVHWIHVSTCFGFFQNQSFTLFIELNILHSRSLTFKFPLSRKKLYCNRNFSKLSNDSDQACIRKSTLHVKLRFMEGLSSVVNITILF